MQHRLLGGSCLLLVLASACSVDRKANPEYGIDCPRGYREYRSFCVREDPTDAGGKTDAETPDTGPGPDSGSDAGEDASTRKPCTDAEAGTTRICYPFEPMSTALQEPCRVGIETCEDGFWSDCVGVQGPEPELCDSRDNDCDGTIDEGQVVQTCTVEGVQGACAEDGFGVCNGGEQDCLQRHYPKSETCNDVDDDCDGMTDDGLDVACYPMDMPGCTENGIGGYDCVPASTCAPGTRRCIGGQMQTDCMDAVRPGDEAQTTVGETPLDEDCDGMIDEGYDCQDGATFTCYTGAPGTRGRAPCHDGMQVCAGTSLSECMNQQTPQPETCANENVDNDCDGMPDDVPRRGTSCSDESTNQGLCKQNATWQCVAGAESCVDGEMAEEVCNGRNEDEDCDGQVDEEFDLQTDAANCGSCGHRCATGQTCCAGTCVSTASSNAHCGGCMNACQSGWTCCSSVCRNTRTDNSNCGTCGRACLLGALLGCSAGNCL